MSLQNRKKSNLKVPEFSKHNRKNLNNPNQDVNESNITIDPDTGFEDLDSFWDKVRSPSGQTPEGPSELKNKVDHDALAKGKKNVTPKEQRVVYHPKFSDHSNKTESLSNSHSKMSKFITSIAQHKLGKNKSSNDALSPSAISTVSTAPPSSIKPSEVVDTPASESSKKLDSSNRLLEHDENDLKKDDGDEEESSNKSQTESHLEKKLSTQPGGPESLDEENESAPLEQSVEELLDSTANQFSDTESNNNNEYKETENLEKLDDGTEDHENDEQHLSSQQSQSKDSQSEVVEQIKENDKVNDMDVDHDFINDHPLSQDQNDDDDDNVRDEYESEDENKEGPGYGMSNESPSSKRSPTKESAKLPPEKTPQLDIQEDEVSIPHTSDSNEFISPPPAKASMSSENHSNADPEQSQKVMHKHRERKRFLPTNKNNIDSDSERSSENEVNKKKRRKPARITPSSSKSRFQTGIPGPRQYESIPASQFRDDDGRSSDEDTNLRRSKRVKFPPLEFWKNEKLVYHANNDFDDETMGDMPVVGAVVRALPTPYKKRKIESSKNNPKRRKVSKNDSSSQSRRSGKSQESLPKFDDSKIRQKYDILDGEVADIWDESIEGLNQRKVVCYSSKMVPSTLPITRKRDHSESRVFCSASQAFNIPEASGNIPGWISGHLILPPKGIKDAEGVGLCSQVFSVQTCQPNSLEMSLADPDDSEYDPDTAQRFLLNPGDFFHVPPNNVYRIENHSNEVDSKLFFTIIRPMTSK